ncbi:PREDICTED: uncharacterized protein LOC109361923 [Lupinus angustifolius]|uniref:uncharacterized protein LOC109361923 n=1 Tax=Lupinus angustifolius TaxID=3871 RepID=UPI00092E8257|nr:PREDICTED: uncharacterized protein LOC109361923 [Lupinus angustifolius]
MASVVKLSYKRLQNEKELEANILEREVKKAKAWLKFKALAGRRSPRLRIARLRRYLRKRTKFLSRVTVSWCNKTLKKLKNGQSHMNDLFGGNFLFMQANPTPFGSGEKAYNDGYNLHKLPTKYSVSRIS